MTREKMDGVDSARLIVAGAVALPVWASAMPPVSTDIRPKAMDTTFARMKALLFQRAVALTLRSQVGVTRLSSTHCDGRVEDFHSRDPALCRRQSRRKQADETVAAVTRALRVSQLGRSALRKTISTRAPPLRPQRSSVTFSNVTRPLRSCLISVRTS